MTSVLTRPLPDPDITLRDAADFILDSRLGRKALCCTELPKLPLFLRDLIGTIYRLTASCHLPEFTDHGLRHLCSIVDRVSQWTCAKTPHGTKALCEVLDDNQSAMLLIAILIHDIGMLSQRPEDLPSDRPQLFAKGQMDVSTWVRQTHVSRIPRLVNRLFMESQTYQYTDLLKHQLVQRATTIAQAHEKWPWEAGFADLPGKDPGLAAVIAVADLLDEDASRCDATTLIDHRQGNMLNYGHWIRHCLTTGRILVHEGTITISFARPPFTDGQISPVYAALRNHYRLVKLYTKPLSKLGAGLLDVVFSTDSIPAEVCVELSNWRHISGIQTQQALIYHVLNSFFSEALLDTRKVTTDFMNRIKGFRLESIDSQLLSNIQGTFEVRSPYEQTYNALISASE
ncbi:MAG TPA: hypothetical protein VGL77_13035 [Armatimonadota bacterium]